MAKSFSIDIRLSNSNRTNHGLEIIGEEKFDIIVSIRYIYILLVDAPSWLLVPREKESRPLFHLSFQCIIHSIMRGPLFGTLFFWKLDMLTLYPSKKGMIYIHCGKKGNWQKWLRFLFFFFEKYVFPCKIFNITDSTDNLQIERACTILRLQICKYI